MAAAALQPQQLGGALVELVVADRVEVEPESFIASIVGSSWKSAESSGLAPIRSPAETTSVFGLRRLEHPDVGRKVLGAPAGTGSRRRARPMVPGVVGSRWPWKSLSASSCT